MQEASARPSMWNQWLQPCEFTKPFYYNINDLNNHHWNQKILAMQKKMFTCTFRKTITGYFDVNQAMFQVDTWKVC